MAAQALLLAFWLFLPAFVANPAAVLWGGGRPMDFGRRWPDGRRVLGDGKTWRGFAGGGLSAVLVGTLQWPSSVLWSEPLTLGALGAWLGPVAALAFGSLLGDVLGSFVKRRLGMEKGQRAPVLDQYDFVLGAFLVTGALFPGWIAATYLRGEAPWGLLLILVVTPLLHRAVNIVGYRMGRKEVPW